MTQVAVIDDDDDLRELMVMGLRNAGYQVSQAADGFAGLDLIRQHQVDLVVVDWMMPRMDGIEVCRTIRAEGDLASVPVLMVTARATPADRSVALAAGADEVLAKPFGMAALAGAAHRLLERVGAVGETEAAG